MRKIIFKAIKNPRKAHRVLFDMFVSPFDHQEYKKFIILSRSRSGTNLLLSLLNSHPNIRVDDEIFQNTGKIDFRERLQHVFSKQPYYVKARGFKIFYYHPLDEQNDALWDTLINMKDLHVVHLVRKNVLRAIVSQKIALSDGIWLSEKPYDHETRQKKKIVLDPESIDREIKKTAMWKSRREANFKEHAVLNVFYEDLSENHDEQFKIVCSFLNVEYKKPKTNLKKQNPEKLSDLIAGYEELKCKSEAYEWKKYLDS